ncbi:MAG: class I fructose-bisphosphate aldolase [Candidatus Zipacnadales bacterium]
MDGHYIRLNRLFSQGRNVVIVAVDHGEFFGPTPGIIDLPQAVERLGQADAILLSPGMIGKCGRAFDYRGAPMAIVRLNWSTVYCEQWRYRQAQTAHVISPQEALALGADIALASLTLRSGDESRDRDNVALFAQLAAEKRQVGIPLIGEFYPVAPHSLSPEELHKLVYEACRILAELGADAIKTFYTGPRFAEVTEACPVPIFALGAEKLPREIEALQLAHDAIASGAGGVVFGRNVIQAQDPAAFLGALRAVVKDGATPQAAAEEYGLS